MSEQTAAAGPMTTIAVVSLSAVAALVLLSALRKTMKRGEWSSTAVMAAAIVILTISYVELIVTYLDDWVTVTDIYRNVTSMLPPWAHFALRITIVSLTVASSILFAVRVRRPDAVLNIPAVFLVIVVLISMGSAILHGDFPLRALSLVFLCILLACTVAPRGLGIHLGIGTVCVVIAIASGMALALHQDFSAISCVSAVSDKCGVLGFNFRGVLDNENALALYLALSMPYVYVAFSGWEGAALSAYMLGLIFLTGSRSGAMAGVITFATLILVAPTVRRRVQPPIRSLLLGAGLLVTFLVGLLLPFLPHESTAYSGRAFLWELARNALSNKGPLIYGAGELGWDHMHATGMVDSSAVYSVHNQWLNVLFTTGLVGLAFFIGAIALLLWQARHGYFTVVGCVLVPVFVLAVSERPWPIDTADWLTWVVPAALLCYPADAARNDTSANGKGVAADGVVPETEPRGIEGVLRS